MLGEVNTPGVHQLGNGTPCILIDDALPRPGELATVAESNAAAFEPCSGNTYPGLELPLPDGMAKALSQQLLGSCGSSFGVSDLLEASGRLAMVTKRPHELAPIQRVCHRDRLFVQPGERALAAVLYLFHDPALGGTGFFRPVGEIAEVNQRMARWAAMEGTAFELETGFAPGYMVATNRYFELVNVVPARWNRLIVYDGSLFHSSYIEHPELLSPDPSRGRLTLNLFMRCRRDAA